MWARAARGVGGVSANTCQNGWGHSACPGVASPCLGRVSWASTREKPASEAHSPEAVREDPAVSDCE